MTSVDAEARHLKFSPEQLHQETPGTGRRVLMLELAPVLIQA
jgi:hypothetical protein